MLSSRKLTFDVASAVAMGKRDTQEDAIVTDFPIGGGVGLVVLADGMGGHNAGDIASKIVVTEVFSELKLQSQALASNPDRISETLRHAAFSANKCLAKHTAAHPNTKGMGATLIAMVQFEDQLFWISIGDSVLYLMRDGMLLKLNQDHSLAPQIDYMVRQGMLTEEDGRLHPDRNCLTSALRGEEIPFIDCPDKPMKLFSGDMILAASDGLPFLGEEKITDVLRDTAWPKSADIASHFLRSIERLDHPEQDNVCLSILKIGNEAGDAEQADLRLREGVARSVSMAASGAAHSSGNLLGRLRGLGSGLRR